MKLLVERFATLYDATISQIYLNGEFICFGMEDVIGKGGIPTGMFQLQLTHSPKFNTMLPLILVPGRVGIRVHAGNSIADVTGCVMAVTSITISEGKVWGSQSKVALQKLLDCMGEFKEGICEVKERNET